MPDNRVAISSNTERMITSIALVKIPDDEYAQPCQGRRSSPAKPAAIVQLAIAVTMGSTDIEWVQAS